MKKRSDETKTLCAGCSKAGQKFPPPQIQTQIGKDRCTQFRVIVVTDPQTNTPTNIHTHKHTDRTDYNTLRRS